MRSSEWRDVALLRGIVLFVVAVILTVAVAVGVSLGRRARNPDQGAKYLGCLRCPHCQDLKFLPREDQE